MKEFEPFKEFGTIEKSKLADETALAESIAQTEEAMPAEGILLSRPPTESLRKEANIQGGALLIYQVIMNAAVFAVMLVAAFVQAFTMAFEGALGSGNEAELVTEELLDGMMGAAGWGYLLAVAIGLLVLLLWKKPRYIRHTIMQKGKPMTVGGFFALLSLTMSAQMIAQVCNLGLEWLLELLGLDAAALQEMANVDTQSLSMFLYIGIAAPIAEELLFRGLLLRSIAPYGKKLAVIASALLFGLYHANPIQTPYAIPVGLVLGYVALEYHVVWAIALHLFNNLVFALLLPQALSFLPGVIVDWILWAVIIGFFLAALLILLAKRSEVATLWKQERLERWQRRAFFRAPTVVILMVICLINMVATMLLFLQ